MFHAELYENFSSSTVLTLTAIGLILLTDLLERNQVCDIEWYRVSRPRAGKSIALLSYKEALLFGESSSICNKFILVFHFMILRRTEFSIRGFWLWIIHKYVMMD